MQTHKASSVLFLYATIMAVICSAATPRNGRSTNPMKIRQRLELSIIGGRLRTRLRTQTVIRNSVNGRLNAAALKLSSGSIESRFSSNASTPSNESACVLSWNTRLAAWSRSSTAAQPNDKELDWRCASRPLAVAECNAVGTSKIIIEASVGKSIVDTVLPPTICSRYLRPPTKKQAPGISSMREKMLPMMLACTSRISWSSRAAMPTWEQVKSVRARWWNGQSHNELRCAPQDHIEQAT